jgi:glycosyltransferase involved in cell wall biosynthesis
VSELLFSVVIPTYNRAGFISKTLQSVLDQTYQNFEIIIVDDGSTDNTGEIVQPLLSSKIKYFKIPNSERAAARNFGIKQTRGDYITFLDSDDIYYKDYLSNAKNALTGYNFPVFFHLAYESKSDLTGKSLKKYAVKSDDVYSLIKGNHLSCIGVFLKKAATVNYAFNEDRHLSGSEDWELWLRLAAKFGLKTDSRISAALIAHDSRSVFDYDEEELLNRKNLALHYSFEDPEVKKVFGKYRSKMDAFCDTYISLHLALSLENKQSVKYLIQAIRYYPMVFFTKRTVVILKYLLLNIFGIRKRPADK